MGFSGVGNKILEADFVDIGNKCNPFPIINSSDNLPTGNDGYSGKCSFLDSNI